MFKWLGGSEIEAFAIALADEFQKRCPPKKAGEGPQPAIVLAKAVDELCSRAAEFQREKKLGVYGKARLGTELKMQMKERGYDSDFVDELTGSMLVKISRS
jgi:hypothetical protein